MIPEAAQKKLNLESEWNKRKGLICTCSNAKSFELRKTQEAQSILGLKKNLRIKGSGLRGKLFLASVDLINNYCVKYYIACNLHSVLGYVLTNYKSRTHLENGLIKTV